MIVSPGAAVLSAIGDTIQVVAEARNGTGAALDKSVSWASGDPTVATVDALGNVPGALLNWVFVSLKPYRLTSQKYVDMVDRLDDREALLVRSEDLRADHHALAVTLTQRSVDANAQGAQAFTSGSDASPFIPPKATALRSGSRR